MIDYVTLAARIELPPHRITPFYAAPIAPEQDAGVWRAWFDKARAQGRVDEAIGRVECIEDLLDYLAAGEAWSQRWKDEGTLEILANTGEGDPWFVRTSLVGLLFSQLVRLGGRGYVYLLDAMHSDEQVPLNHRLVVTRGELHEEDLDVEQAWEVRDRLDASGLWPVLDDLRRESEPEPQP